MTRGKKYAIIHVRCTRFSNIQILYRASYGGIKIINHPGEEDPQVKRIRIQIQHAEEEHQALLKELEKLKTQRDKNQQNNISNMGSGVMLEEEDIDEEPSEIHSGVVTTEN